MDTASVRRWLAADGLFAYLAPDGFLGYGWHGPTDKAIQVESAGRVGRDGQGTVGDRGLARLGHGGDPRGGRPGRPGHLADQGAGRVGPPGPQLDAAGAGAVAAIAGRGFRPGLRPAAARLADPDLRQRRAVHADRRDGKGSLERAGTAGSRPQAADSGSAGRARSGRAASPRCTPGCRWPRCGSRAGERRRRGQRRGPGRRLRRDALPARLLLESAARLPRPLSMQGPPREARFAASGDTPGPVTGRRTARR